MYHVRVVCGPARVLVDRSYAFIREVCASSRSVTRRPSVFLLHHACVHLAAGVCWEFRCLLWTANRSPQLIYTGDFRNPPFSTSSPPLDQSMAPTTTKECAGSGTKDILGAAQEHIEQVRGAVIVSVSFSACFIPPFFSPRKRRGNGAWHLIGSHACRAWQRALRTPRRSLCCLEAAWKGLIQPPKHHPHFGTIKCVTAMSRPDRFVASAAATHMPCQKDMEWSRCALSPQMRAPLCLTCLK